MTSILKNTKYQCRVSSVFNRDVKLYGKNGLFDDSEETCWSSDQGTPQWIYIGLDSPTETSSFKIQFQGGYVGQNCHLDVVADSGKEFVNWHKFYPEDVNSVQEFKLEKKVCAKQFKFVFESSSDFFGRIVIYSLTLHS